MTSKGSEPGNPQSAPVEIWRTPAATAVGGITPDEIIVEDGEGSVIDMPNMGEFSAEAARSTPLDDIAQAERSKIPKD